ncbi:hypothetical protein [Clostridium sp. AM34-9AC]|jgi:hypothetical protein|uniref:hypothetical protein n=1 Tax=Clostridium sp. AM34-9AC TaxID=2293030 RepID=UPI0011C23BCC|nr:hypothetical protein [Clostridium sp. AM34-9AC]
MQFTNYWQQFEHTGRVEDYLKYLQSAGKEEPFAGAECKSPLVDCRAEGRTDLSAGEDGSCRNPCM